MTKIDIISGFLGAGKTTLIKKLINDLYAGEKLVLIENEFGEISVDGGFLKSSGVEIKEMNSGCICCSLSGDFKVAMLEVIEKFSPDRILIEPSGVGKLSDVMAAVTSIDKSKAALGLCITVVDSKKCKLYSKNFGEFFNNQIEFANVIVLSRTQMLDANKVNSAVSILRNINKEAGIVTTAWDSLTKDELLQAAKGSTVDIDALISEAKRLHEEHEHQHEHDHEHHHDHDHEHEHHHDHDHEHDHHHDHDHEHEHHHDHDHEHEHHHDHDHEHDHHHDHAHEHDHHDHHHAEDIFDSMAVEGAIRVSKSDVESLLNKLSTNESLGVILRAKGIVENKDGGWIHFDMVPDETDVREGTASYTGVVCVIGSRLDKDKIDKLIHEELHIG